MPASRFVASMLLRSRETLLYTRQTCLHVGDRLGGALEQHRPHPELSGGDHIDLHVVEEDDLAWVNAQPFAGDLIDPPVRLLDPSLIGVDQHISHRGEAITPILLTASTRSGVAEDGSPIAAPQPLEV